jgi:hypothetical protein
VLAVIFCLAAIGGSFVMSFATWVAIGTLAGFGALAVAMPLCVDGHVMTALTTWLSPVSERLATFAKINLYAIGAASVIAQSAYHGIVTWQRTHSEALTLLALVAGAFPPVVATLAAHIAVMTVRESFVSATSEQPAIQPQTAEASPPAQLDLSAPELSEPRLAPHPSPEAVSPAAASQVQLADRGLSAGLAAVPALVTAPKPAAARSPLSAPPPAPERRVTVEDVRPLLGLGRAEIARQLGTSVATVDRRLRAIRKGQKVPA